MNSPQFLLFFLKSRIKFHNIYFDHSMVDHQVEIFLASRPLIRYIGLILPRGVSIVKGGRKVKRGAV